MDFDPAPQLRHVYQGVLDIFKACLGLLRELARKNEVVQQALFDRLDFLMKIPCCEQEIGLALCEVFRYNESLCLQVSPHTIRALMAMLARNSIHAPSIIQVFLTLVTVTDKEQPIKRNQILVIKALTEYRKEVLEPAFLDDEDNREFLHLRFDLLSSGSDEKGNPWPMPAYGQHIGKEKGGTLWTQEELDYNIWLVDLLASCGRGGGRYVESVLQATFSVEQLLQLFNEENTALIHKRPYIRFLVYVHILSSTPGISQLVSNK